MIRRIAGLILVLLAVAVAPSVRAQETAWETDIFKAYDRARDARKPLVIAFETDWCDYCKILDEKVFSIPRFLAHAPKVVLCRVNPEKDKTAEDLATSLGVDGYPTLVVMEAKPESLDEVGRVVGWLEADKFMPQFETLLRQHPAGSAPPAPPESGTFSTPSALLPEPGPLSNLLTPADPHARLRDYKSLSELLAETDRVMDSIKKTEEARPIGPVLDAADVQRALEALQLGTVTDVSDDQWRRWQLDCKNDEINVVLHFVFSRDSHILWCSTRVAVIENLDSIPTRLYVEMLRQNALGSPGCFALDRDGRSILAQRPIPNAGITLEHLREEVQTMINSLVTTTSLWRELQEISGVK